MVAASASRPDPGPRDRLVSRHLQRGLIPRDQTGRDLAVNPFTFDPVLQSDVVWRQLLLTHAKMCHFEPASPFVAK